MAEGKSLDLGRQPLVSQQEDAADPADVEGSETRTELRGNRYGDLEERRETQEVLRPSSDGMGDGLVKDQS